MINYMAPVMEQIHELVKDDIHAAESQLLLGTVRTIDPLSIELENGDILPSGFFYLSDFVIAKKVRFRVHRAEGRPLKTTFQGIADEIFTGLQAENIHKKLSAKEIEETLKAETLNENYSAISIEHNYEAPMPESGSFSAETIDPPDDIGVSGDGFTQNTTIDGSVDIPVSQDSNFTGDIEEQPVEYTKSINGREEQAYHLQKNRDILATEDDPLKTSVTIEKAEMESHAQAVDEENIEFEMEVIETEEHEFVIDTPEDHPHQDQTTIIEGVLWRGLQVGDIVLMQSLKHNQQFFVHRIINRDRDQYEHGIAWDNRVIDGRATNGTTLGYWSNTPRHSPV